MPGGLRTARHCVFTGGVVEENSICRAGFLRKQPRGGKNPLKFTAFASRSPFWLRDLPPDRGEVVPLRGSFLPSVGQRERSSPFGGAGAGAPERVCSLPLGEVSPQVTEKARPLRKSAGGTERTLSVIAARCHLPRRGRFCSACRQIAKSSPFGGAGCDQREQTERVFPLDISPLPHYNTSKMNHSKMKG